MARPIGVCEVCRRESDVVTSCPFCGHEDPLDHHELSLPVGTLIHDRYRVGNPLGAGGFGITYRAWQGSLDRTVAIKEYLPTKEAGRFSGIVKGHSPNHDANFRFGLETFKKEARRLAQLSHENIVRVIDLLEANGTAYLVMEYRDGKSLEQLLKESIRLPEREAMEILLPILNALEYIHRKSLWHCDVNPSNIYLLKDKTPLLLDFGAARSALGERTQNTSMFTQGYAAYEQYYDNDKVGPWTDIHAVAATLYKMVTGIVPPSAIERKGNDDDDDTLKPPDELVPEISPGFSRAILAGLALKATDRPQSAEEFRKMLELPGKLADTPTTLPELFTSEALQSTDTLGEPPAALPELSAATVQEFEEEPVNAPTISPEPFTSTVPGLTDKPDESSTALPEPSASKELKLLAEPNDPPTVLPGSSTSTALGRTEKPVGPRTASPRKGIPKRRPSIPPWMETAGTVATMGAMAVFVFFSLILPPLKDLFFPQGQTSPDNPQQQIKDPKPTPPVISEKKEEPAPAPVERTPVIPQFPDAPSPGQVHENSIDGLAYVWIPPGEFQMGCTFGDKGCDNDEWSRDLNRRKVRHQVKIGKGFWLGQTEVTVAAYKQFAAAEKHGKLPKAPLFDPSYWKEANKENYPVVNASWYDARDYCIWAGGHLTSEAEWEYAARGDHRDSMYPWRSHKRPVCQFGAPNGANFNDDNDCGKSGTKPVGSYAPNGYRLYDMGGNVWEFVKDEWHDSYRGAPEDGSAWEDGKDPQMRVFRGGSWSANVANLRVSTRSKIAVGHSGDNVGFRCAIPPKEPEAPESSPAEAP